MAEKYNADSITVLEGLEAVRRRPGMYIGSVGTKGLNHLIYEILDNSVDEHLAGYCTKIWVTLDSDGSCTVRDNGRGIPVGIHKKGVSAERVVMTTLHAGGKFNASSYKISGGLHGVGSSVVNALSSYMRIRVFQDGKIYEDEYSRGIPTKELSDGMPPVIGKTREKGTEIRFIPDPEIFEKTQFRAEWLMSRLHETAYLNPELSIHYCDRRGEEEILADYHEPEGLRAFVRDLDRDCGEAVSPEIYFRGRAENTELECCIQFTDSFEENILGFCNDIYTQEGGTHIVGFKTKFTQLINGYARELGLLKEKDPNFTGADTRNGMTAVIALKYPEPIFEGQTKTKLASLDAAKHVAAIAGEELSHYFDRNIEVVKAIIGCAEKSARIRRQEEKAKTNLLSKSKYSFDSNGKLANCISREPENCEIFIVEGDSAGGSAKSSRDRNTQAILPLRGKILNVEKASIDKVLANAEIKTMINAFGCGFSEGYGNDFDISKLRYHKIILMTDADVDGSHIDTLLLTFFYRFMPDLIREGHVYVSMPPLYLATPSAKKEKAEYLYDDKALLRYREKHREGSYEIKRFKGLGEMDPSELWETTLNPENRVLKRVEIEDARLASEVTGMLMGTEVGPRREFIYEHAREATIDA
ncbi:DNA gyrase, B subunit, C-terminal domain protein [Oribacterium sp. oral taxon 078 str. F0262]|uniref:DNA gyrase/topoisomerase IV subunit B n=1 Tax=Oribacterium sp. oral taxon 078 TaxID=652706 RepID=UPI0001CDF063|nr:DNA gyrase subunit B [Oribacterium sp. oral taxon 078]EFE92184.1 DNA gyrase, B subunit, C-terminal domain protein [Oribacterium sp. oral taxon 078 str. F0262]